MHVTIVGAGALGRVYGTRLSLAGVDVSFVVRPKDASSTEPFVIEQVNGARERHVLERPTRVTAIPRDTDAVLVTVRFDQLEGALTDDATQGDTPVVVITPLLPEQRRALAKRLGERLVPAMPGVVSYASARGAIRYWIVGAMATLLDDGGAPAAQNRRGELARHLERSGFPTRVEHDVASMNAATTVAFFPLVLAIDAGGGVDGVLGDRRLLEVAMDAAKESTRLAAKLGRVVPAANLLMKYVGPFTLRAGVALARRLYPEAVTFVDQHFGPKLRAQSVAMGEAVLELGREHGVEMRALGELVGRLRARPLA
jgi:2-dehydropantoate 2-reductase